RAEFLNLVVVRCVSLAIERRRARWTKLRAAAHSKRYDESPLRQSIRKKRRRSRNPHARTAATWRRHGCVPTIVGSRYQDLARDVLTPHDAGGLLWAIRDSGENRGMKRIERRCISRK